MGIAEGGSDMSAYCREFSNSLLSTAINKYMQVNGNQNFFTSILATCSKNEEVIKVADIAHYLARNSLQCLQIPEVGKISTIADISSGGIGQILSSIFTISFLYALNENFRQIVEINLLIQDPRTADIDLCLEPIGKQDQQDAVLKGLKFIGQGTDGSGFVTSQLQLALTLYKWLRIAFSMDIFGYSTHAQFLYKIYCRFNLRSATC